MYATVRRYPESDLATKIGDRASEVNEAMGRVPGLRAYYLIQAGDDAGGIAALNMKGRALCLI